MIIRKGVFNGSLCTRYPVWRPSTDRSHFACEASTLPLPCKYHITSPSFVDIIIDIINQSVIQNQFLLYLDEPHQSLNQRHNGLSWDTSYLITISLKYVKPVTNSVLTKAGHLQKVIKLIEGLTVLSIKSGSARSRTELRIRWSLLCNPWKQVVNNYGHTFVFWRVFLVVRCIVFHLSSSVIIFLSYVSLFLL